MVRVAKVISIFAIILLLALLANTARSSLPFKMQIKNIYESPSLDSKVVYEIPADVKIIDMTDDRNWYRVRIEFMIPFLGTFNYKGWVNVPMGEVIGP